MQPPLQRLSDEFRRAGVSRSCGQPLSSVAFRRFKRRWFAPSGSPGTVKGPLGG